MHLDNCLGKTNAVPNVLCTMNVSIYFKKNSGRDDQEIYVDLDESNANNQSS